MLAVQLVYQWLVRTGIHNQQHIKVHQIVKTLVDFLLSQSLYQDVFIVSGLIPRCFANTNDRRFGKASKLCANH